MNSLKIAFVIPTFPNTTETFIVNQIVDLIDRGHKVLIFSFDKDENAVIHQKIVDYELVENTFYYSDIHTSKFKRFPDFIKFILRNRKYIKFKRLIGLFNFKRYGKKAFNLRNFTKYKWILDKGPFDIIHSHFGIRAPYIAEMKSMGFLANTSWVTSFHGYDLNPSLINAYKKTYKALFEEVDMMTVNSEYLKSVLLRITSTCKVKILPVGLNTQQFARTSLREEDDRFTILFVGRLVKLKGPDLAIKILRAFLKIQDYCNVQLIIVGEGEMKSKIQELIKKYNLHENVTLKGSLPQEKIYKLMETADIFLLPGIHDETGRAETQGLVIQEAQAMEIPVLVSDAGGMKYGMIHEETGFVVKEKDIKGFANKIQYLLKNGEVRKKMGVKGRKFVLENYDSKILGAKLEGIYYNLKEKTCH